MKSSLLFLFFFLTFNVLSAQDSLNMVRLARWDDDTLPIASPGNLNLQYSGIWALTVKDREYAVIGGALHVLIFDVTQPTQPALVGKFAGNKNTIWREFKSYKNRVYAVSDNTDEGLMIFDLTNAPNNITRTYYSNEFFNSSHTITLDTISGRIYLNGTNVISNGSLVLSVKDNPDKPVLLASKALQCGYIHDSYVRNDTLYASSGNNGYCIYDFRDYNNPKFLAAENTGGYNHNSWLTRDGRYAFYTEEIPRGQPIQVVDLQNLSNGEIEAVHSFLDNLGAPDDTIKQAIPHNVYIRDHYLYDSQYEDGLLVNDISNPLAPVLKAHYDTHPENMQYNGYYGNWGNYPWLPSGTIVTSDMQNGLFLLKLKFPVGTQLPAMELPVILSPNPASDLLSIRVFSNTTGTWNYRLFNAAGQISKSGASEGRPEIQLRVSDLPTGLYFMEVRTEDGRRTTRRVVID